MHKAQLILQTVREKLTPLVSSGLILEILTNTSNIPDQHPVLIVKMGDDDLVSKSTSNFRLQDLNIHVDIKLLHTSSDMDELILNIREQVEKIMLADTSLGLSFVLDTNFTGQQEPEYEGDADFKLAEARLMFTVRYRTKQSDPSA